MNLFAAVWACTTKAPFKFVMPPEDVLLLLGTQVSVTCLFV